MTRSECEVLMLQKIKEIVDIYHKYNPQGKYLSVGYVVNEEGGRGVHFNNNYWEKDAGAPVNMYSDLVDYQRTEHDVDIQILQEYRVQHGLSDYSLCIVEATDVRVGDIVCIAPACYPDMRGWAEEVTEVKDTSDHVVNGYVFEPGHTEIILRKDEE